MDHITAVLLDVDGTLVDSNDAHARAWVSAFAESGIEVEFETVRRLIGMGGDHLMPRVSGLSAESRLGARISRRRQEIFMAEHLPRIQPFPGTRALAQALVTRGFTVVAASSARGEELDALLEIAGVKALLDAATSNDDADRSKPAPDIVEAALSRAGAKASAAVLIGDTPYDIEAATRAGVATVAFRTGRWPDAALHGAVAIYDGPWDLVSHLEESIFTRKEPHVAGA